MKKIFISLFALGVFHTSIAQTTAMDFTQEDCNGNNVHLFELLDQGHVVILEFFMDNCSPCISAGNAIEPVYVEQETAHPGQVHWFHFGFNNTYSCATVSAWVEENGFPSTPFTNGASQVSYYGGFGMPTVIVVGGANHDILFTAIGWSSGEDEDVEEAIIEFFGTSVVSEQTNEAISFAASFQPSTQNIQLDLNSPGNTQMDIEIYTSDGHLVTKSEKVDVSSGLSTQFISAAEFSTGIYLVTIRSGKTILTEKVSITK